MENRFFTIYFHDLRHGNKGGYKGLHGVTRGYRGLQEVTGGYKGLQGVTRGDKGLQGVTRGYMGLQRPPFLSRTSAYTISRSIFDKDKR